MVRSSRAPLFGSADASWRFSRRGALRLTVAAALAAHAHQAAAQTRPLQVMFYDWIPQLHPAITATEAEFAQTFPLDTSVVPSSSFGFDRFTAEAQAKTSSVDLYVGETPFVDVGDLLQAGAIEPWDPYLPPGLLDDFIPATRAEGTFQAAGDDAPKLYVWPVLLDVVVLGWHAGLVASAGLDPEEAPTTWDAFFANAQQIVDRGAALYALVFDSLEWRSLIPITHSISTDVYTPEGLFRWTSEPALQALEIMKRMMPLTIPNVLNAGSGNTLPDEEAFATEQVAYFIKYQNAPVRTAGKWHDPTLLRLAKLPAPAGGAGGTVFWDTGAVLFKYGQNKAQAVEFVQALGNDDRIWQESIAGSAAAVPGGQLPVLRSKWAAWKANLPPWLAAHPWATTIVDGLNNARAIPATPLGWHQFSTARAEWLKYLNGEESDPRVAMQKAQDAVAAAYKAQTGNDPSY